MNNYIFLVGFVILFFMVFQLWLLLDNREYIRYFNKSYSYFQWGSDLYAYNQDYKYVPQLLTCVESTNKNWYIVTGKYSESLWLGQDTSFSDEDKCLTKLLSLNSVGAIAPIKLE